MIRVQTPIQTPPAGDRSVPPMNRMIERRAELSRGTKGTASHGWTSSRRERRDDVIEVRVDGTHLQARPAERLTPALREAITRLRPALVALLAPAAFCAMRCGLVLPVAAIQLAVDLESRGIDFQLDADTNWSSPR